MTLYLLPFPSITQSVWHVCTRCLVFWELISPSPNASVLGVISLSTLGVISLLSICPDQSPLHYVAHFSNITHPSKKACMLTQAETVCLSGKCFRFPFLVTPGTSCFIGNHLCALPILTSSWKYTPLRTSALPPSSV